MEMLLVGYIQYVPKGSSEVILNARIRDFGAANIADADKPPSAIRADREVVPEEATRTSTDNESFHVGRGGAANVHLSAQDQAKQADKHNKVVDTPPGPGATPNQSLADKLKHKIFGKFKKEK
ncbi:hypothetical protein GGS26DRAFT_590495 [Hypomontagnella submonticulosa]|nr:hypothetical protein GGS26DRAFT_590495 [Hypomontagnella submonticulosa]